MRRSLFRVTSLPLSADEALVAVAPPPDAELLSSSAPAALVDVSSVFFSASACAASAATAGVKSVKARYNLKAESLINISLKSSANRDTSKVPSLLSSVLLR